MTGPLCPSSRVRQMPSFRRGKWCFLPRQERGGANAWSYPIYGSTTPMTRTSEYSTGFPTQAPHLLLSSPSFLLASPGPPPSLSSNSSPPDQASSPPLPTPPPRFLPSVPTSPRLTQEQNLVVQSALQLALQGGDGECVLGVRFRHGPQEATLRAPTQARMCLWHKAWIPVGSVLQGQQRVPWHRGQG